MVELSRLLSNRRGETEFKRIIYTSHGSNYLSRNVLLCMVDLFLSYISGFSDPVHFSHVVESE